MIAIKLPHKANQPVEIKRKTQMAMETITGNGNKNILNGRPAVPFFFRSSITPTACPINWTMIRMASIELITSDSLNNKLNKKPNEHRTINEM